MSYDPGTDRGPVFAEIERLADELHKLCTEASSKGFTAVYSITGMDNLTNESLTLNGFSGGSVASIGLAEILKARLLFSGNQPQWRGEVV